MCLIRFTDVDDDHMSNNECKVTNGAGLDGGEGGSYSVCDFCDDCNCDVDCNLDDGGFISTVDGDADNNGSTVDDDADNNGDGEHGNINDIVVDDGDVKIDSTLLNDETFDDEYMVIGALQGSVELDDICD